jgi:hypothetical protein
MSDLELYYHVAAASLLLTFYLQVKILGLEPELESSVRELLAAAAAVFGLAPAAAGPRCSAWRSMPYDD